MIGPLRQKKSYKTAILYDPVNKDTLIQQTGTSAVPATVVIVVVVVVVVIVVALVDLLSSLATIQSRYTISPTNAKNDKKILS